MARRKSPPAPTPNEPRLLTPDVQATLCTHVAKGVPLTLAASLAGVSPRAFFKWLKRGRLGDQHKDGFSPACDALSAAIKKAQAEDVARRVGRIDTAAGNGSWQADAWHLERTRPEHFGSDRRELRELRKALAALTDRLARLTPPPEPDARKPDAPAG